MDAKPYIWVIGIVFFVLLVSLVDFRLPNGWLDGPDVPSGKITLAPDGRVMATTRLSDEDAKRPCEDCHDN